MKISKIWINKKDERFGPMYSLSIRVPYNSDFKHLPVIDKLVYQI